MAQNAGQQGLIFDFERFSTKDGPGIRTAVFFKGCNLHCAWCHNPEGIRSKIELAFQEEKCVDCGMCFAICRQHAHQMAPARHRLQRDLCKECLECTQHCFSDALRKVGQYYSVEQALKILLQDAPYYAASGGGVTLTGGEVMLQKDFAAKLLSALHAQGIHTAMETNLCVPWEEYGAVLDSVDLFMVDCKTMRKETFQRYIGEGFERVCENLTRIFRIGKPLIVRTPVIPTVNADEIGAIARLLRSAPNLLYYELLSYHRLGNRKARMVGRKTIDFPIPTQSTMRQLGDVARIEGISVCVDGKTL